MHRTRRTRLRTGRHTRRPAGLTTALTTALTVSLTATLTSCGLPRPPQGSGAPTPSGFTLIAATPSCTDLGAWRSAVVEAATRAALAGDRVGLMLVPTGGTASGASPIDLGVTRPTTANAAARSTRLQDYAAQVGAATGELLGRATLDDSCHEVDLSDFLTTGTRTAAELADTNPARLVVVTSGFRVPPLDPAIAVTAVAAVPATAASTSTDSVDPPAVRTALLGIGTFGPRVPDLAPVYHDALVALARSLCVGHPGGCTVRTSLQADPAVWP